jgi:hypothetical protein
VHDVLIAGTGIGADVGDGLDIPDMIGRNIPGRVRKLAGRRSWVGGRESDDSRRLAREACGPGSPNAARE